jgi:energy-coupling factor transporter transmembrane protein EcfT
MRPIARPGAVLAAGLLVVACAALLPAGLDGRRVPASSWISWTVVLIGSLVALYAASGSVVRAVRGLAWLLPTVLLLTLPAVVFAAGGRGAGVALALVLRALTAATAGLATVTALGPSGLVRGLRSLRVPSRLVEIVHAMLVGLAAIGRQVSGMLRARAARRTSRAPWSALAVAPVETLRGFGRLVGALLLRSIERAESLERARRARGGLDA